mmetsp:Transcript_23565/g.36347  ORF Transcript_23565/g.36347 Transcript_23565/m.36347 type:complete len:451 (-) Transcript_23565:247-1599(-)
MRSNCLDTILQRSMSSSSTVSSCRVPWLIVTSALLLSAHAALSYRPSSVIKMQGKRSHHSMQQIPRVKANDFSANSHYYHERQCLESTIAYETPVIVEGALSPSTCESICDRIASVCGSLEIDVQRKRSGQTNVYQCSLEQAFDLMMLSKRDDAIFAFCEGLLDGTNLLCHERDTLTTCREKLFANEAEGSIDEDWFKWFPTNAQPSDCVILAGEGATSTLHRDPFEWTGTSICLEGTKVWRFVQPPGTLAQNNDSFNDGPCSGVFHIDNLLQSYRLNSLAWGDNGEDTLTLSKGWQSDFSLYSSIDCSVPSARELAKIEEKFGFDEKIKMVESIGNDQSRISPTVHGDTKLWSGVQRAGDLIIIPAYWWHQTYALEPSLAVASQRCGGKRDAARVIQHILNSISLGCSENVLGGFDLSAAMSPKRLEHDGPRSIIKELFDYIHGVGMKP